MDERIDDIGSKNIAIGDHLKIVLESGGNGPKRARTKFTNIVIGTIDKDRTGKTGSTSDTTNAA